MMRDGDYPFLIPITIARGAVEPLQRQVFDEIRVRILDGRLLPGARVTSIRELARQLGLSINTVRLAYQQLISEGYLETAEARGTFVAETLPDAATQVMRPPAPKPSLARHAHRSPPIFQGAGRVSRRMSSPPGTIDFWPGRTDPRSFPSKDWLRLTGVRLGNPYANMTDYGDAAGLPALRIAIAEHLGRVRGFRPDPEQIVITSGIQEALCITSKLLIAPDGVAVTEAPCYVGASYAFQGFGARIARIEVDEEGLVVDDLPQARVALAYITASHQFPLGRTLSMERRAGLLHWASTSGAYIIEDDYDSDFWFESSPLPALAAMDERGSVIYLGTFSKAMGAGLRLGYMVVPEELVEPAVNVKSLFSVSHEWLTQAVMADYIGEGGYARHLRQLRHDCISRRNTILSALRQHFGTVTLRGLNGGMHIVWHMPENMPTASELERRAAECGARVYSPKAAGADVTCREVLNEQLLVFGYASLLPEEISKGVDKLAACL